MGLRSTAAGWGRLPSIKTNNYSQYGKAKGYFTENGPSEFSFAPFDLIPILILPGPDSRFFL